MKKIIIGMVSLCIILGAVFVWLRMSEDRTSPVITFPDVEVVYQEGQEDTILDSVTAIDNIDGDVTDTIFIESIIPNEDKTKATVTYVAKDNSNNISRVTRNVIFSQLSADLSTDLDADDQETPETTEDTAATGTESHIAAPSPNSPLTTTTPSQTPTPTVDPEAPNLILSKTKETISRGASFNRLSFVHDITDDKDSRESLFRKIQITGNVNTSVSGEYQLIYYVIDSDGNMSNNATLLVTVR